MKLPAVWAHATEGLKPEALLTTASDLVPPAADTQVDCQLKALSELMCCCVVAMWPLKL